MKDIMTRSVPAWSLVLTTIITILALGLAWFHASENRYLKSSIRRQEALVPGFLEHTSILSEQALCRRNLLITLKDRLIGSDSCSN